MSVFQIDVFDLFIRNSLKNCIIGGPMYLICQSEKNSVIRFFDRRRSPLKIYVLGGSILHPSILTVFDFSMNSRPDDISFIFDEASIDKLFDCPAEQNSLICLDFRSII